MNQIIELLITSKCQNLKQVANVLGITLHQVKYDIDWINHNFTEHHYLMIKTDNKESIIINDIKQLKNFYFTVMLKIYLSFV